MRKLPVLLILILIALWTYTAWYWYTCKIKGFCSIEKVQQIPSSQEPEITSPQGTATASLVTNEDTTGEEKMDSKETQTDTVAEVPPSEEEPEVCNDILSKAISLGGSNPEEEVMVLEKFLNETQGESLDVDGRYSQDDFDAVKRFQLKYRQDILDPWEISTPTGYVYTTTIKKINEIHCSQ